MKLWAPPANVKVLAGVDEVGRGPLAGDVVTAAVILPSCHQIVGLADSKALTSRQRENLYEDITGQAITWAVGRATVAEIDRFNILASYDDGHASGSDSADGETGLRCCGW